MPALSNIRHEKIVLLICEGYSQLDAWLLSGKPGEKPSERTARRECAKVLQRPEVKARLDEIQAEQAKRVDVSVDSLIGELNGMLALAKRTRQPGAGVGAVLAKARLLGLITDKQEIETTVRKPSREPTDKKRMSVEEWQEKFTPKGPVQ